ncbi:MAG TPA: ATP-grasp domain-containing protein [Solimonas sp.]|nr:ATP-grasp domain-containing protein [Solimonas sp.]
MIVSLVPRWFGIARLPKAMADAGLQCAALCPERSFIARSGALAKRFHVASDTIEGKLSLDQLEEACHHFLPQWIVPADEHAITWMMNGLSGQAGAISPSLRALLQRSMGQPQAYAVGTNKWAMAAHAGRLGIEQPATARLQSARDIAEFAQKCAPPWIVKPAVGFGGGGVRVCATPGEAARAFALGGSDQLIQQLIPGETWMCAFFAFEGRIRAALTVAKERQNPPLTGPSTVVRFEATPKLREMAARLIAGLGFSGFGSIDAVLRADGKAWFIEFNPRPVPIAHLGRRAGPDLCAAFACTLHGKTYTEPRLHRLHARIALYPQEFLRDPTGDGAEGCEIDRPDDDPKLLAAMQAYLLRQQDPSKTM